MKQETDRAALTLGVAEAVVGAARSNDLLPARLEDDVSETRDLLLDLINKKLDGGPYRPSAGLHVPVPKSGFTTRLATLLSIEDRVVLEAVVSMFTEAVEQELPGSDVVYGPRGTRPSRNWTEFERAPLLSDASHIVRTDIVDYYESVPHRELCDRLGDLTSDRGMSDTLRSFLSFVMGSERGLPQGVMASDALATFYLSSLDKTLLRGDWQYLRKGDDIRVAVSGFSQGRRAIALIEAELRRLDLHINDAKTFVLPVTTYRKIVEDVSTAQADLREHLEQQRIQQIREMESEELESLLLEHDLEETIWDLYHGSVTIDEVIEQLESEITPEALEVGVALLERTLGQAPGKSNELAKEVFKQRLASALALLGASRSAFAVPHIGSLLYRFPEVTPMLCGYLRAVSRNSSARKVVTELEAYLLRSEFRHAWQEAWLFDVLLPHTRQLSGNMIRFLKEAASDERRHWFSRVYAVRLLARRGDVSPGLLEKWWNLVPVPLRIDLVAAMVDMANTSPPLTEFLETLRGDPAFEVVRAQIDAFMEPLNSES